MCAARRFERISDHFIPRPFLFVSSMNPCLHYLDVQYSHLYCLLSEVGMGLNLMAGVGIMFWAFEESRENV